MKSVHKTVYMLEKMPAVPKMMQEVKLSWGADQNWVMKGLFANLETKVGFDSCENPVRGRKVVSKAIL